MRTMAGSRRVDKHSKAAVYNQGRPDPPRALHFKGVHFRGACRCLVCGRLLAELTNAHAEGCGYPDKAALIAAGKVEYLGKGDEK
ncbi:hypothetical protein [Anaeroselena agilis]|uniref:Uncharacterized protein n=1 Tax=Anaeroselena agilis TaxID=3063788 RepID=A0ABU3P0U7_9FIRM|nr:hypothetical protein [Selenomonadales bacterium 4137-cl]